MCGDDGDSQGKCEAICNIPTRTFQDVAKAIEQGLEDSRNGNVISLDEHRRLHAERRLAWIQTHQAKLKAVKDDGACST